MTQEEKYLLLKDLCSRLPYKVIVDYSHNAFNVRKGYYVEHGSKCILTCYLLDVFMSPRQNEKGEYIKPHLRPMSSMTDEERKEYELLANHCMNTSIGFIHFEAAPLIDWLDKNHFDHRGLIPKGLAVEVTEENNPYKRRR